MARDNLQPQVAPFNINPKSPDALYQVIEVARQLAQAINLINSRLEALEEIINN